MINKNDRNCLKHAGLNETVADDVFWISIDKHFGTNACL